MNRKPVLSDFINKNVRITSYSDFGVYISDDNTKDILFLNDSYKMDKYGTYRTWYELLNNQYNEYDKLYILNIRNVNHWLKSRYLHNNFVDRAKYAVNKTFNENIDDIQVLYRWKALWYKYHCNLLEYFQITYISKIYEK